jgi:hypothetical protein
VRRDSDLPHSLGRADTHGFPIRANSRPLFASFLCLLRRPHADQHARHRSCEVRRPASDASHSSL